MAFRKKTTKRRSAPKRKTTSRKKSTRRSAPQTIRIVLEQPQLPLGIPTSLPSQVGGVAATPRKARF